MCVYIYIHTHYYRKKYKMSVKNSVCVYIYTFFNQSCKLLFTPIYSFYKNEKYNS